MRHVMPASVALCGVLLTVAAPAFADDAFKVRAAKIGANLAGYNYSDYESCHATAQQLAIFKAQSQQRFAAAGADFAVAFAEGQADAKSKWAMGVRDLGEAKLRASVCPNALANLQKRLAR